MFFYYFIFGYIGGRSHSLVCIFIGNFRKVTGGVWGKKEERRFTLVKDLSDTE